MGDIALWDFCLVRIADGIEELSPNIFPLNTVIGVVNYKMKAATFRVGSN
jgi:hypothetical protein